MIILKCKLCNNLLASEDEIKKYLNDKFSNSNLCSRYGLFKPLIYNFGGNKIELFGRDKCFDCFELEFKRKPKKCNIPNSDLIWFFPDLDEEKLNKIKSSRNGITKKKLIKLYGNKEGINKWDKYCKTQSITNKFKYKQKKYGMTEEEFNNFNKLRACTLNNFIRRHGKIEGNNKWNNYCKLQSYVGSSLKYFEEKYGKIEGKKSGKKLMKEK